MKILVYETREDELDAIRKLEKELPIEIRITAEIPSLENVSMAKGYDGISILGQGRIDGPFLDALARLNVHYISTRTIGYNHIDLEYAKKLGIHVCNASYAPNGVADFTIMMMLMCLRQYKQALWRGQVNDFSLAGLMGREMKDLTVGVMGTGRIGAQVIRELSGFGCRILAYDVRKNPAVTPPAIYADLDTLYAESDIITLHMPLFDSTREIINQESIGKMKKGVVIINCARGELADMEALIEGIESEHIGALGIDTAEGEEKIIHQDHKTDILADRNWFYLHQFRNVIMTQHMAFYTDAAVESMVKCGILGIYQMITAGSCDTELTFQKH